MQGKNDGYGTYSLKEGACTCFITINHRGKSIYVGALQTATKYRRQGHATRMMKQIVRIARRLGYYVRLCASPYGWEHLSLQQTIDFYKKCGLKEDFDEPSTRFAQWMRT